MEDKQQIKSVYLQEQKKYKQEDLILWLKYSDEDEGVVIKLLRKLKEYGILKMCKSSDKQKDISELQDEDVEISDVEAGDDEYGYYFFFVGVIVIDGRVLKCYPKYLSKKDPKNELRQALKVIEKYNNSEQDILMFTDSSESTSYNLLALSLYLLQDYFENGTYSNPKDIIEDNGDGEIIWDKTINETFPIILNNRPYYFELKTKKRINNEYDYFKRLHECILTKVSKDLAEADLLDLFDLTGVELSDETLNDFGEKEYILYRIERELNTQFNTRKQLVLKAMYAYIDHDGSLNDMDSISLFGTNSFNLVWEKVCANIMDNQLYKQLNNLPIPLKGKYEAKGKLTLKDLIDKPCWGNENIEASKTLEPDLISIARIDNEWQFIIFDAKYYNAILEGENALDGQPGVESVVKQYMYQLAYQQFIDDHNEEIKVVKNCFIFPTEENEIRDGGVVYMPMFRHYPELQDIEIRFLPAKKAFDCYLNGDKMDISEFSL